MRTSRNAVALIIFLVLLVCILLFWKFLAQKPEGAPTAVPIPVPTEVLTPTPAPTFSPREKVISFLPIVTENYTIQYLPVPKKFLVLILKNPFEKYKAEVGEWLKLRGLDPESPDISWGSARGVAPKTP